VFGNGAGCNTISGEFFVDDVTFDSQGNVLTFAAQVRLSTAMPIHRTQWSELSLTTRTRTFVDGYYMDGADGGLYGFVMRAI